VDSAPPEEDEVLTRLCLGELEVRGRLVDASNATLFAVVTLDGVSSPCVYKPVGGERPLWDFPSRTLARREVAAYELSRAARWGLVPPTVLRDGPFGQGSVQLWVEAGDPNPDGTPASPEPGADLVDVVRPGRVPKGWLRVLDAESMDGSPLVLAHADDPALRRMAVLDAIANNADRKGGHVLRDRWGRVRGVDHGLTFNTDHKLRTVLWGWAGRRLDEPLLDDVRRVSEDLAGDGPLARALRGLLSEAEVRSTARRAADVVRAERFPRPRPGHPTIPWPAF
jgi:uncharacterized repeat protein (TIGR03843 family)